MTTPNVVSDQTNSGSTDPNPNESEPKPINPDDHKRAVSDMLKYKSDSKAAKEENERLNARILEIEAEGMKEKDDYKGLYETEVSNHVETKSRADRIQASFYVTQKHNALYPALKKAGLTDEAEKLMDVFDLSSLEVETTSEGRVFVNGVDTLVEKIKADYSFAFVERKAPTVNSGGGTAGDFSGKTITPADIVAVEMKSGRKSDEAKQIMAAYVKQQEAKRS